MSVPHSGNGAQTLSHSMGEMYVNTPLSKKAMGKGEASFLSSEDDSLVPLSPPPTIDVRQKRERSESLMQYHTNDNDKMTKRRLRSRSRIGFDDEMGSSIMTPPCSSKSRERSRSIRSQLPPDENFYCYPKTAEKHPAVDIRTSSVFITPCSEETRERKPLMNRDLNAENETSFDFAEVSRIENDLSIQSDSDSETPLRYEETRTKLIFEEDARRLSVDTFTSPYHGGKIIGRRIGLNKVDIIKELVNLNCEEICKKIFCYLVPQDLQRVASVSKLWRRICKKDRVASPRLDQFIHGRKQYVMQKGKENLGSQTNFDQNGPQRHPFSDLKSNTIWSVEKKRSGSESTLDLIKTDILSLCEKMKCPFCGSPSKKIGEQICKCDKCQETFCRSCQHRMDQFHKAKCEIKANKSQKGKANLVIGSKKSKCRLKRY